MEVVFEVATLPEDESDTCRRRIGYWSVICRDLPAQRNDFQSVVRLHLGMGDRDSEWHPKLGHNIATVPVDFCFIDLRFGDGEALEGAEGDVHIQILGVRALRLSAAKGLAIGEPLAAIRVITP